MRLHSTPSPFIHLYPHSLSVVKNPEHHQGGNICIHTYCVQPCTQAHTHTQRQPFIVGFDTPPSHDCAPLLYICVIDDGADQTLYVPWAKTEKQQSCMVCSAHVECSKVRSCGFPFMRSILSYLFFPTTLAWIGDTHSRSG